MNNFVDFITNHWVLSTIFILLIVAMLVNEWVNRSFGATRVTLESAVLLMNHHSAVVLDLRSESAFSTGHIIGAHHLPVLAWDKKIGTLQKYKDKPIILVCAEGQESSKASGKLKEKGFQVVVLEGGIQAWRAASLPLVKS